jgi:anti-sigma B factor antagonist
MTQPSTYVPGLIAQFCHTQQQQEEKESKLKSNVEISVHGDVLVVKCRGRVVNRDEAADLFSGVIPLLSQSVQFVLDLSEVEMMDGAGLGELLLLLNRAQDGGSSMKIANPSKRVSELLDLTRLSSVFDIYPSVEDAVNSCRCEVAS